MSGIDFGRCNSPINLLARIGELNRISQKVGIQLMGPHLIHIEIATFDMFEIAF